MQLLILYLLTICNNSASDSIWPGFIRWTVAQAINLMILLLCQRKLAAKIYLESKLCKIIAIAMLLQFALSENRRTCHHKLVKRGLDSYRVLSTVTLKLHELLQIAQWALDWCAITSESDFPASHNVQQSIQQEEGLDPCDNNGIRDGSFPTIDLWQPVFNEEKKVILEWIIAPHFTVPGLMAHILS